MIGLVVGLTASDCGMIFGDAKFQLTQRLPLGTRKFICLQISSLFFGLRAFAHASATETCE